MQRIESPTSKEHLGRLLLFLIACVAFGAYFLYDSFIGYPRANVPKLAEKFEPVPNEEAINELKGRIRADITDAWKTHWKAGDPISAVRDTMGEPTHVDQGGEGAWRYLGRGGLLTVRHQDGKVTAVEWTDGTHRPADLRMQLYFAALCGALGLVVLFALVRALRIRVVVSDEGLRPSRGTLIGWDAMRGLDASQYQQKGWVFLKHDDDGRGAETRLDSYKIREFRAVIGAICERKGFASPFESSPRAAATPAPDSRDGDRGDD